MSCITVDLSEEHVDIIVKELKAVLATSPDVDEVKELD